MCSQKNNITIGDLQALKIAFKTHLDTRPAQEYSYAPILCPGMSAAQLRLSQSQSRHAAETRTNVLNRPALHECPKYLHERIDDFIVTAHRAKDISAEDTQAGLCKSLGLLKEARDIVASQQARKSPGKPRDVETLVSQIWDDVRQLKWQAKNPLHAGTSLTRSWVSVAASGTTPCSTSPSFGPAQAVKPTAQRLREVKIKFTDSMERSGLLGMTNKAILEGINRHFLTSRAAGVKGSQR